MGTLFESDQYPGKPKILFIGLAESSHTQAWINLLNSAELNVRLFALSYDNLPPEDWNVKTYVAVDTLVDLNPSTRKRLLPRNRLSCLLKRRVMHHFLGGLEHQKDRWLAKIIQQWQPDIIHTLGLDPAGYFYFQVRKQYGLHHLSTWVVQLWGGSDLELVHLNPTTARKAAKVIQECDQIISDNAHNFDILQTMGMTEKQRAPIGIVPVTGGIDIASLSQAWQGSPSKRNIILWPKAYNSPWSLASPVLEAIRLAWDHLQSCQIYMLAMTPDVEMWYWSLPEKIRQRCHIHKRISRGRVLELMAQARVMLAPTLIDGTPNSLLEAMAVGAFPIVSPLKTIRAIIKNEQNVLFARNLYPQEIADALCRAMSDDALIDRASEQNLKLVYQIADRAKIKPLLLNYYKQLATGSRR